MVGILRLVALAGAAYLGWWLWEHYRPVQLAMPAIHEKGVYRGPADTELAAPQAEALSQRAASQR